MLYFYMNFNKYFSKFFYIYFLAAAKKIIGDVLNRLQLKKNHRRCFELAEAQKNHRIFRKAIPKDFYSLEPLKKKL